MAATPEEWQARLARLCVSAGISTPDAEECACDILLRYHHCRDAYPWDEPTPDERLLRLLTRDVIAEHLRTLARRQRLEPDHCAQRQALIGTAETLEQQAIAHADTVACAASSDTARTPRPLRITIGNSVSSTRSPTVKTPKPPAPI